MSNRNSSYASGQSSGSCEVARKEVLERAVGKVMCLGARVGIHADQMIEMLDSRMTIEELLRFVLSLIALEGDVDCRIQAQDEKGD